MLLALAMLAQDVPINAEASEALTCARAVTADYPANPDAAATVMLQSLYFVMRGANADPVKGRRFLDRAGDIGPRVAEDVPAAAEIPAILARCDKSHPLARSTARVTLPADPFARDLLCIAVASYVIGALDGASLPGGIPELRRVQGVYFTRVSDNRLEQHGLSTAEEITDAMDAAMRGSLKLGNMEQINKACAEAVKVK